MFADSPAPSMSSTQRRGTYTVKVHGKRTEARTEFPNANPPLPDESDPILDSPLRSKSTRLPEPVTPREQSRLTRLKQDPSVASLLYVYDDDGRIMSTAFSNTPGKSLAPTHDYDVGGRAQTKRSGSTFQELLGNAEKGEDDAVERDISWAERLVKCVATSLFFRGITHPYLVKTLGVHPRLRQRHKSKPPKTFFSSTIIRIRIRANHP